MQHKFYHVNMISRAFREYEKRTKEHSHTLGTCFFCITVNSLHPPIHIIKGTLLQQNKAIYVFHKSCHVACPSIETHQNPTWKPHSDESERPQGPPTRNVSNLPFPPFRAGRRPPREATGARHVPGDRIAQRSRVLTVGLIPHPPDTVSDHWSNK